MTTVQCTSIRKVGNSLYLRVPASYVREHELEIGDVVIWTTGGRFKIIKRSQFEEFASRADASQAAELEAVSE